MGIGCLRRHKPPEELVKDKPTTASDVESDVILDKPALEFKEEISVITVKVNDNETIRQELVEGYLKDKAADVELRRNKRVGRPKKEVNKITDDVLGK